MKDCVEGQRPFDFPKEPSIFGMYNILSGPFADQNPAPPSERKRTRSSHSNDTFDDGHGFSGPSDVGKRGRDKERERMRLRAEEMRVVEDDDEDWFGGRGKRDSKHPPPWGQGSRAVRVERRAHHESVPSEGTLCSG